MLRKSLSEQICCFRAVRIVFGPFRVVSDRLCLRFGCFLLLLVIVENMSSNLFHNNAVLLAIIHKKDGRGR